MSRVVRCIAIGAVLSAIACSENAVSPDLSTLRAGKAVSGPSVSAADPAWAHQGDTGKQVTITGSGFQSGAAVQWLRNGAVDPHVAVRSVTFVNSTTLNVTIDVALDAEIAFYDVAVMNPDRKQGIGTELFEVTTAVPIGALCTGQSSMGEGVNTAGQAVGASCGSAFYWEAGGSMMALGPGFARDIDEAGLTIVGDDSAPWVRTRTSPTSPWVRSALPNNGYSGIAYALASDASGSGVIIGGYLKNTKTRPITNYPTLWFRSGATWQRVQLPLPSGSGSGLVRDVNSAGQAVGGAGVGGGVVWEPDGSGGYTATVLPGTMTAQGISPDGNVVVGLSDNRAAYWYRSSGAWVGPNYLAPVCPAPAPQTWANKVNANYVIVGKSCDGGHVWQVAGPVIVADLQLHGLGDKDVDSRNVFAVSDAQPARAVGRAAVAVYWDLPF